MEPWYHWNRSSVDWGFPMNGGLVIVAIVGVALFWTFLYWCLYLAVKAAIRDARRPEFDPSRDDRPLMPPAPNRSQQSSVNPQSAPAVALGPTLTGNAFRG